MSGIHDFDFLHGAWTVSHRRLRHRGVNCGDWDEVEGSAETRPLLGGLCNVEEHSIPGASGVAFRSFDPAARVWSIVWVSASDGLIQPPVVGRFTADLGHFEGEDQDSGKSVRVRFLWDRSDPAAPTWAQSFSYDGGATWELNWTMQFRRQA